MMILFLKCFKRNKNENENVNDNEKLKKLILHTETMN